MGDFVDTIMGATGAAPSQNPVWQIPPEVQAQRDQERLSILKNELQNETDPNNQAALKREISRTSTSIGGQVPQQSASPDDFSVSAVLNAANQATPPGQLKPTTQKPKAPTAALDIDSAVPVDSAYKQAESDISNAVSHTAYNMGSAIVSGWRGLATLASGGSLDDAANAVQADQQSREQAYQNALGQPTIGAKRAEWGLNLPGAVIGKVANVAGSNVMDATNSPALATAVETGVNALPMLLMRKGGNAEAATPEPAPATELPPSVKLPLDYDTPTYLRNQRPAPEPVNVNANSAPPSSLESIKSTTTEQPPAFQVAEAPKQPISDPTEMNKRAQVLQLIGVDNARKSALAGDAMNAATEYQMTKFNEPAGVAAKEQFNAERSALESYAEKIVNDTGGSLGMDQETQLARGNTILQPLEGLKDWFDRNTSQLYQEADARAQGVPTSLNKFQSVLSDDSQMTNSDRVHLRNAINSYAKQLGITQADGSIAGTAQQAETVRKYLNENWSPQNSKFVSNLKDALDDDVTSAAGDDIYQKARAMRQMRAVTLDDPNGISKIMDASGPNGINRVVPAEKVASNITALPDDQFQHIVRVLRNVPQELQPQAQAALGEIKANFANQLLESGSTTAAGNVRGVWNGAGVNKIISSNGSKISSVFSPEEMKNIQHLIDAGNILRVDTSYPGAAAQAANALKKGLMSTAIQRLSTLAGGAAGSLVSAPGTGAVIGEYVGGKLSNKTGEGAALKKFQKGTVKLSDMLNP